MLRGVCGGGGKSTKNKEQSTKYEEEDAGMRDDVTLQTADIEYDARANCDQQETPAAVKPAVYPQGCVLLRCSQCQG